MTCRIFAALSLPDKPTSQSIAVPFCDAKWQALQSEFGITCDMSMENTSVGSSHKCHDNA